VAQLVLPGGESREVTVFLAEAVPGRIGGERLSDLLNAEAKFIPVSDMATGRMTFLNSASIALARVDSEQELREEDQLTILTEHEVEVRLVDGQRLQGLFTYVLPDDRSRLTDYLNSPPAFLRLVQGQRVVLVNKRHVAYVEPLSH
jgi:PAS domain-containing protein